MNALLNYPGAKWGLAREIVALMPWQCEVRVWWNHIENLLSSVLVYRGIKPDATPEDIYAILRLLGWEVSD